MKTQIYMIFNGLKEKFNRVSAAKFLKQELSKPTEKLRLNSCPKQIGILLDLDRVSNISQFEGVAKMLNLNPDALHIMGYRKNPGKNETFPIPVFTDKHIGWKGKIEYSPATEFVSEDYDLLINYFNEDNLALNLVAVRLKAGIRVGFHGANQTINDVILNLNPLDYKQFESELHKYLKILTKWL